MDKFEILTSSMKAKYEMAFLLPLLIQKRSLCALNCGETGTPRSIVDTSITTAKRQLTPHKARLVGVCLWGAAICMLCTPIIHK